MPRLGASFSGTNADTVDAIHASAIPTADTLLALNADAIFNVAIVVPLSLGPGESLTIPTDRGMVIPESYTVNGTLTVNGVLKVV